MLYKLLNMEELLKKCIANIFTHPPNTFIHAKCLVLELYGGLRQHLSWNSLWRKLTTESH